MKIIGFNFDKISIEKKEEAKGKVDIKSKLDIDNVEGGKVDLFPQQSALHFHFKYSINYEPKIAEIDFGGYVVAVLDKKKAKETLKEWKKKGVSDEIRLPIFNLILTKSNLKSLQLEEDVGLPTHIRMPKLTPQQPNADYVK